MSKSARKLSTAEYSAAMVRRAQRDPGWFMDEVLQLKKLPTDADNVWERDLWQTELLESVADVWRKRNGWPTVVNHEGKTQITMRSMHGPGKTFGIAALSHYFNFCWPGKIFATAPKLKQVTTLLFSEFRKIHQRSVDWYRPLTDIQATKVTWCGDPDWCLMPDSAANPENMAGKHHPYVLVLVDEASGVPETLWPVILAALSTGKVLIMVMISNPTQMIGTFADSHLKPELERDYHRVHVSLDKTRRVSREWVAKMIRRYGENSPVVKVRCLGEFAGASSDQLFHHEWLERARVEGERPGDGSHPRLRVTADVADGGDCESVVTVAKHYDTFVRAVRCKRYSFLPAESPIMVADEAEKLFFQFGGKKGEDDFVIDSVGVGAGTAGTLIKRGHRVIVHKGGEASSDPKRWRNQRAQSHFNARDALRDNMVVFSETFWEDSDDPMASWTEFFAQMVTIKTRLDGERVDDLVPKATLLKEGIASPDIAESFVMQFATMMPSIQPGTIIAPTQPVVVIESDINSGLEGF